jgi:hypothetical protein
LFAKDPEEHYQLYAIPVGAMVGGYALANGVMGIEPNLGPALSLTSGVLCVGGIAGYAE